MFVRVGDNYINPDYIQAVLPNGSGAEIRLQTGYLTTCLSPSELVSLVDPPPPTVDATTLTDKKPKLLCIYCGAENGKPHNRGCFVLTWPDQQGNEYQLKKEKS